MDYHLVERRLGKKTIYRGNAVNFCVDKVRLPNGKTAVREYLDHPGAVCVVAFLDPKTVVLVRQYRYPVGEVTLEIPAGKLDEGESLVSCVKRELREETGFTARRINKLMSYWPTPAFANEILHIFVAEGLTGRAPSPDPDEFLEVETLAFKNALGLVRSGKIRDSKTVIALLACALRRKNYNKFP